jgi:hypothetical protein
MPQHSLFFFENPKEYRVQVPECGRSKCLHHARVGHAWTWTEEQSGRRIDTSDVAYFHVQASFAQPRR